MFGIIEYNFKGGFYIFNLESKESKTAVTAEI